jgi:hypothetical protein
MHVKIVSKLFVYYGEVKILYLKHSNKKLVNELIFLSSGFFYKLRSIKSNMFYLNKG